MCLPCVAATGFTGLSFLEGPLKDCTKIQNPNKQNWLPARVCSTWLFVLRSRPCSPEGGVKTPAVKPCIIAWLYLPRSDGSKELSAKRICCSSPPLVVDLVKYNYYNPTRYLLCSRWFFFHAWLGQSRSQRCPAVLRRCWLISRTAWIRGTAGSVAKPLEQEIWSIVLGVSQQ